MGEGDDENDDNGVRINRVMSRVLSCWFVNFLISMSAEGQSQS